jgi:hypothetical protein
LEKNFVMPRAGKLFTTWIDAVLAMYGLYSPLRTASMMSGRD